MAISESQKRAIYKYQKSHLKRVPLDLPLPFYEDVRNRALSEGLTVNGFIKHVLRQALETNK